MYINANQPESSSYELITAEHQGQTWCDVDRERVIDSFKKHGAILFRGFSAELDGFIGFTDKFCDGYVPNPLSERKYISKEKNIQLVDSGNSYFPLHAERSQTPFRADIAFFHCRIAPRSGGQTFFCDGSLLVSRFPDSLREKLMPRLLLYRGWYGVEEIMAFLGITNPDQLETTLEERGLDKIFTLRDGRIFSIFTTPIIEKPRYSEAPAFANFLLFSRFGQGNHNFPTFGNGSEIPTSLCVGIQELAQPITTLVNWEPYDLLMLDNTRVMHGRMPIENVEEREILTRFGYANFS